MSRSIMSRNVGTGDGSGAGAGWEALLMVQMMVLRVSAGIKTFSEIGA